MPIDKWTLYQVRCDLYDFDDPNCTGDREPALSRQEAIRDAKKEGWYFNRKGAVLCPHCKVKDRIQSPTQN